MENRCCPLCGSQCWKQATLEGGTVDCCSRCGWTESDRTESEKFEPDHTDLQWKSGAKFMQEYAIGCCKFWLDELSDTPEYELGVNRVEFVLTQIVSMIEEDL